MLAPMDKKPAPCIGRVHSSDSTSSSAPALSSSPSAPGAEGDDERGSGSRISAASAWLREPYLRSIIRQETSQAQNGKPQCLGCLYCACMIADV